MKRETIILMGAAIAAVACGGGAPTATDAESAQAPQPGFSMGGNAWGFEATWMAQMIDHHAMAVEMGEACLAPGAAYHPELLELCGNVITMQSAEIASMTSWLAEWYGITYEPGSTGMMMPGDVDLSGLAGDAFELEFLEEMIPHHQQAVHMSGACIAHATHEELRALCASIIETQSAEIASMQTWLCDWYGRCDAIPGCPGGTTPAPCGSGGDGTCPGPNAGCAGACPIDGTGLGPGPYADCTGACPGAAGGMGPGGTTPAPTDGGGGGPGPGPMHGGGPGHGGGHR